MAADPFPRPLCHLLAAESFVSVPRCAGVMNEPDLHKALLAWLGEPIPAINIAVGSCRSNTAERNCTLRCSCLLLPRSARGSWQGVQPPDGAV